MLLELQAPGPQKYYHDRSGNFDGEELPDGLTIAEAAGSGVEGRGG